MIRLTCLIAVFLLGVNLTIQCDPWGKDADLAFLQPSPCSASQKISTPILGELGEALINFHQDVISPCDGPRSHFIPSSSQYTLDAMRKYGFFKGFQMGCDRLMRENSEEWIYPTIQDASGNSMKWDPVR